MKTKNLIRLSDIELSQINGGGWGSWLAGFLFEAIKDAITLDSREASDAQMMAMY